MKKLLPLLLAACTGPDPEPEPPGQTWECQLAEGEAPDYALQVGCLADFEVLSSAPLDASIPGARSMKTVMDRSDDHTLYFQNSERYLVHWDFASANLSGNGLPVVPDLGTFNLTEYYSPDRRFVLGAVTWYEEPDVWAYEIAPYDTADAEMIAEAFRAIRDNAFFGDELRFHPSSVAVDAQAALLPADIPQVTTEELFRGIRYQPLNLGTSIGKLAFHTGEEVADYVNYREIVVLDAIPNDISIVAGIITDAFQTPLSHINVLSQNRGTPNMGLRDAWQDPELRALEGRWVELTVSAFDWSVREVSQEEADAWWEDHRPEPIETIAMDLSVREVTNAEDVIDQEAFLGDELAAAIPVFGGKASHYAQLVHLGEDVPVPPAILIPVWFYHQHLAANGLWDEAEAMMADADFRADATVRAERLADFMDRILEAPLDPDLEQAVLDRLAERNPGERMRFRSSTTAEDLGAFTGAGLYTSVSGQPGDPDAPVADAIRTVWASVWNPRAWEEREYYGIDHLKIGMAILSHRSFPEEEANGVAITANPFDPSGLEPAFYINVQHGDYPVVLPYPGMISDQLLYYYALPGQPVVYIAHSNLVGESETVLSAGQLYELGRALDTIHWAFYPVYGFGGGFYAMDTEFKFEGLPGEAPDLYMKQARPYPGRGTSP